METQITLSESEARALVAIMSYSSEGFIRGFYVQMGRYYLEPHAHAVPGLFDSVKKQLAPAIAKVDAVRKEFNKQ